MEAMSVDTRPARRERMLQRVLLGALALAFLYGLAVLCLGLFYGATVNPPQCRIFLPHE